MVLGFGLVSLLATLLTSTSLGFVLAERSRAEADASLHEVAGNAGRLLADGLFTRMREVQVLADSPTLWTDGLASERVRQVFLRSQALNPHAAWIGVTDAQGTVMAATGGLLEGAIVQERPWFQWALKGLHVGDVHPAHLLAKLLPAAADGGPMRFVDFAAPIRDGDRVVGVIAIHGSWDWANHTIEKLLPETLDRKRIELFIFDRDGRMIYQPTRSSAVVGMLGSQALPVPARRTEVADGTPTAASVIRWNDGLSYRTVALPVEARSTVADLGWTVVARQPAQIAELTAKQAALLALMVGLAASAAAAWLGWLVSGALTRELVAMGREARTLARLESPQELSARGGCAEVAQLSHALRGLIRRLLHAKRDLEEKVRQRTEELSEANRSLEHLATTDALTGLLNRRGLDDRLQQAVASARRRNAPLCMLALDADHFKRVNDTFGHDVGDRVLQTVALIAQQRLREVDFAARVGGEEFVLVLVDTGLDGAQIVARDLLRAIRSTPIPPVACITVSCGISEMSVATETAAEALQRADTALYRAKQSGRDRYHLEKAEHAEITSPA